MKKPFSLFLALLATLSAAQTPADRDAARKAAEAERLPSAETLYKQHKWREAEKAFSAYASGHPRPADAAAALLRVADCREKMDDRKGSTLMLDRVARDAIASCDVDVRPFQPERPIPYKWVLMDKSATEYRFEITHAFSSLEYGFFQGKLAGRKQGGGGPGRPEVLPFDVTVPAVDIDWNEAYGWQEELDEDNTVENIPATAIPTERRTFLIREPDDSNRHRIETLQLAWDKPDALQVLRVDTGEEVTSGWTFRREDVAFPLFFQAIPKDGGWGEVTLTLEGWAGRPRPEYDEDISFDKIKGRIVRIDLDVDSDNNGTIDEISPSAEDDSEDDATLPGKALFLNELDTDRDGIPDWADGYDVLLNGSSQKSANASRPFTLLRLEAKAPPVGATIRFECSSLDDTASAFLSGNGIRDDPYTYATAAPIKKIRIWAKNGDPPNMPGTITKYEPPYRIRRVGFLIHFLA